MDKLGVTYTDMDSAIASGESNREGSANRDQTPNHIVYRKVSQIIKHLILNSATEMGMRV